LLGELAGRKKLGKDKRGGERVKLKEGEENGFAALYEGRGEQRKSRVFSSEKKVKEKREVGEGKEAEVENSVSNPLKSRRKASL